MSISRKRTFANFFDQFNRIWLWNYIPELSLYLERWWKSIGKMWFLLQNSSPNYPIKIFNFHWLSMIFWVVCTYVFDRISIPHVRTKSPFTSRMAACFWNCPIQSKTKKIMCICLFDMHLMYAAHKCKR